MEKSFNIRVYGLLINDKKEVLLSDENRFGKQFTKFPGGGLEWGEGTRECLVREFMEELGLEIEVGELFYATDFFQSSAWNNNDQIMSIYYFVKTENPELIEVETIPQNFKGREEVRRWISLNKISKNDVTFPIDKVVTEMLRALK